MKNLILKNCLTLENKLINISIVDGIIKKISEPSDILKNNKTQIIECDGNLLIPGLVDIHTQGAGGYDILDSNENGLIQMSETLAKQGTTSFLATTVFKKDGKNKHLQFTSKFKGKNKLPGAEIIGIHLEGPFINSLKIGGLNPDSISETSLDILTQVLKVSNNSLSLMTLAPELENMHEIITELIKNNVIPSLGHSDATFEEVNSFLNSNVKHITHIFNAIPGIHHRMPGPITAAFLNNEVTAQIISDGVHLHPSIVNLIYKNIGVDRCICITDGMQATGLPEGEYYYNNKKYISKSGSAKYENGTLIGCTLSLLEIAKRFNVFTNCGFIKAIQTVTKNPADLLGIKKGRIEVGYDADLVLLDKKHEVLKTIISGNLVFG